MKAAKARAREISFVPRAMPHFVPPLLSFVAGYIDVVTFIALFGLYVAQVTGSFVVVGAQLVGHGPAAAFIAILAIPVFLLAAILTVFFCYWLVRHGRSLLGWSLALETALIAAFYVCTLISPLKNPNGTLTLAASVFALAAMGVQSALVRLLMRNVASTNVMTTNTSLLGIDAAEFLLTWNEKRKFSRSRRALNEFKKARRRFYALARITLGFIAGAALGAVVYHAAGAHALIAPAGIAAALSAWAFERDLTSGNR
jgi:uncharacterized membrane protein YoaK (UPF0700 family)